MVPPVMEGISMSEIDVTDVDVTALRERFLEHEFDAKIFEVDAKAIVDFAVACGERAPRYVDPSDPNFQASPTFTSTLMISRQVPADFPKIAGLSMNAGKSIELKRPIRPGTVTGRSRLHDIYEKTGRSGRMLFVVSRMEFYDARGDLLALSDSRQVIREKPNVDQP